LISLRRQRALATANAFALVLVLVLGLALTSIYSGRGAAAAAVIAEAALAVTLFVVLARADRSVVPRIAFAWRPLTAVAAGAAALAVPGLGEVLRAVLVIGAFVSAAVVVRAVPYEVLEALRRRDPGSRGTT
jgi:O-antigen/teichoic acid export membrane protein